MGLLPYLAATAAVLLGGARADNSTLLTADADTCGLAPGPWGALLEEWALAAPAAGDRHGRIMALPPAQGYYVTDRVDRPPPPPYRQDYSAPTHPGPFPYDEWQPPSPPPPPHPNTKIVNRPPHKDKFKPSPSYNSPPASQQIPAHHAPPPPAPRPGAPAAVDRVGEAAPPPPPRKQVSETDLYLLSAIEKLVWRVDLMEKRLRKMEESMHHLVAGADKQQPEPCVSNFTRLGEACYHYSGEAADWKSANIQCRKLRANLLELDSDAERRVVLAAVLADTRLRGTDVWTGGLNPGLLWIWSHSARPVVAAGPAGAANSTLTVVGDGRCLALVHDPAHNTYVYRGQDCALRHRFICEKEEDRTKLSNEIERGARALAAAGNSRSAKIMWAHDRGREEEQQEEASI